MRYRSAFIPADGMAARIDRAVRRAIFTNPVTGTVAQHRRAA